MSINIGQGIGFMKDCIIDTMMNIKDTPNLFDKALVERAQHILGISEPEIKALKAWMIHMQIIEKCDTGFKLTQLGEIINTYDPYLKIDGTWWILHIILSMSNTKSLLWSFYSNFWMGENPFTQKELLNFLLKKKLGESIINVKIGLRAMTYSMLNNSFKNLGIMVPDGGECFKRISPKIVIIPPAIIALAAVYMVPTYNSNTIYLKDARGWFGFARMLNIGLEDARYCLERLSDRYLGKMVKVDYSEKDNTKFHIFVQDPLNIVKIYYMEAAVKMDATDAFYLIKGK